MKICQKWELKAHAYVVLQRGLIAVISIPLLGGREERGSSLIKQGGPELGAKCLIFHLFKSASVD